MKKKKCEHAWRLVLTSVIPTYNEFTHYFETTIKSRNYYCPKCHESKTIVNTNLILI
jgi:hypothetical protein